MSENGPDGQQDVSRRDFQKLLGVSGAAVLGGVSLAGCQGETEASIPCPYCEETFESESALKDHLPSAHADELRSALGSGPIGCPYGDQEFDSLEALRAHIKAEHADEVSLPDWDEETDIVVAGSGFAGLAAAIEAAKADVDVRVFEKMSRAGGNSRISGGGMAVVGSDLQVEQGIEDSVELFMEDLLEAGRGLNHESLIEFLGDKTKETYEWTIDELGVEWTDEVSRFGGHSVPRSHTLVEGSGWGIVEPEIERLNELGVEVETNVKLEELYKNGDGEVVGVKVIEDYEFDEEDSGSPTHVKANEGVVLATGGFGEDVEWRSEQYPLADESLTTTNHPGATGEAIREAISKDANPVQLSWIQLGPWVCPEEKGFGIAPAFAQAISGLYGMWVDPETGERFVNEMADRRTRAQAEIEVGNDPEYPIAIADSTAVQGFGDYIANAKEKGIVYEFESLQALAEHFGIPVDGLSEQVETYNGYVEQGKDEQFGKILPGDAKPLTASPWYAMRLWPKVHHTMGGVLIDTDARVKAADGKGSSAATGETVPNLYAAGEVAGGIHGGCRLGTVAYADCLTYGRIAGAVAAGRDNPYK